MKTEILKVNLSELKEYHSNPRQIKKDDFARLKKSIKEFPEMLEVREIVVDENNEILGGNQRYKALKANGETKATVKRITGWTEEQKRQFVIRDNVQNGEWDTDILANEWSDEPLGDWGIDVVPEVEAEITEDDAPEVDYKTEPIAKLGDIWQLGRHRLMCGDSTSEKDVARLMNGDKADMVFTDPPYGYQYQSNMRTKSNKFDVIANDDKILDFFPLLKKYNNGFVYVCTTWKVVDKWIELFKKYYKLTNMIIWDKGGGGIGDLEKTFSTDYEIILVSNNDNCIKGFRYGSVWKMNKKDILKMNKEELLKIVLNLKEYNSIWKVDKDKSIDYIHPTQKPVALTVKALRSSTDVDNIVLDLFGGSGTTMSACEQTGRNCYMMELDPRYVDVIIKRWENFTGEKAIKL